MIKLYYIKYIERHHMRRPKTEQEIAQYVDKMYKRIYEIDVIRGIIVLFMIFDHLMFDIWGVLPGIFNFPGTSAFFQAVLKFSRWYWGWPVRTVMREFIIFLFMALTGISCSFSHSNFKRSGLILGVALGLTAVTYVGSILFDDPEMLIAFGVLHCIGVVLLILSCLEKFIKNKWFYVITGTILIGVGIYIRTQCLATFYASGHIAKTIALQIIGLREAGGDSFPIILYGGEIFMGYFIGKQFYQDRKSVFKASYHNNFITRVGRHAIWIYILHQVVLIIALVLLMLLCGYQLYM